MKLAFVFLLTAFCYTLFDSSRGQQEGDAPTVKELENKVSNLEGEVANLDMEVDEMNKNLDKMNETVSNMESNLVNSTEPGEPLKAGQPKGFKKASDAPEVCNNAVDVMFVADTSGSIGPSNFQKVLDFMAEFVQAFNIGQGSNEVRVGLVTYATQVVNKFNMNEHGTKDLLLNALSGISNATGGGTNTHLALDYVKENSFTIAAGDRTGVPNVAIVITDGVSNNLSATRTAAENLQAANVIVFGIGVGSSINADEIKTIASGTDDDNYYLLSDFDVLDTIQEDIEKKTCSAGSDFVP